MHCHVWLFFCGAIACGGCSAGDHDFIPGTGALPGCTEAPARSLDGTLWFDQGTVTIRSAGCLDATAGDTFATCALNWAFSQQGGEVTLVVDGEYRIDGRLCGDQLHLRGGWWLPVQDAGACTYDDDSADEVRIQAEGNVLTVSATRIHGTLVLAGSCDATYEVTFAPVSDPSL